MQLQESITLINNSLAYYLMWQAEQFQVGRRHSHDEEKVTLQGRMYSRSCPSSGRIYLSFGITQHFRNYDAFVNPLTEEFDLVVYNQRGHGKSEGEFDARRLADDLDSIIDTCSDESKIFVLSHSAGSIAGVNSQRRISGAFMINPYLDQQYLSPFRRAAFCSLYALTLANAHRILQPLCNAVGLREQLGFSNSGFPFDTATLLHRPQKGNVARRTAFAVSDRDEILGTLGNRKHYHFLRDRLRDSFLDSRDYSHLVRGLNHCLNKQLFDFHSFMRSETGKDNKRIVEAIGNFYQGDNWNDSY